MTYTFWLGEEGDTTADSEPTALQQLVDFVQWAESKNLLLPVRCNTSYDKQGMGEALSAPRPARR